MAEPRLIGPEGSVEGYRTVGTPLQRPASPHHFSRVARRLGRWLGVHAGIEA